MNYQTQQLIETATAMMVMMMGVGMVRPMMLQQDKTKNEVTPEATRIYMLDPEVVDLVKELNSRRMNTLSSHAGGGKVHPRGYVFFNRVLQDKEIAELKAIASKYNLKNLEITRSDPERNITTIEFDSISVGGKHNSVPVELPETWTTEAPTKVPFRSY